MISIDDDSLLYEGKITVHYYWLHKSIGALMKLDPEPGTPEGTLLLALAKACEQYEDETLPPPFGKKVTI